MQTAAISTAPSKAAFSLGAPEYLREFTQGPAAGGEFVEARDLGELCVLALTFVKIPERIESESGLKPGAKLIFG